MNRRKAIGTTLKAAAAASVLRPQPAAAQGAGATAGTLAGHTLYLNPASGSDTHSGAQGSPLRTLAEAARRVNESSGTGPVTIVLSEGVYAVGETTLLKPERRSFSRKRALDDPGGGAAGRPRVGHRPDADADSHDAALADVERAARSARRRGERHADRDQPRDDPGTEDPRHAGGGEPAAWADPASLRHQPAPPRPRGPRDRAVPVRRRRGHQPEPRGDHRQRERGERPSLRVPRAEDLRRVLDARQHGATR